MEISKADQIALDDALVAPANRLKIGKCNLRLSSDVTSKEATLQVVYDVLKLTPFYKAFQVSADVPEIYMQEFWASAYIHNRSVRFKMNNKKHILNLDQFRDILQICLKVGNEKFEEPPLEKEILAFLASLGHSGEIRKIIDVNGMYNNKKVGYAYLLWEDFIYQIKNKNMKKGNAMYYPRFTKLIVNFVMAKDPSIPQRNKVNWHYARDDPMFTTINVISRNEDTQLYGTILPTELINEEIRNSESYKEYYAIASGKIPPKTKASMKKAYSDAPTKHKPPTVPKEKKGKKTRKGKHKAKELETISEAMLTEAEQLKIITKRSRKETHNSHAGGSGADEGTVVSPGIPDAPDYDPDGDISWKSSEDDQDDDKNEDDTFDPIVHTPSHVSSSDDEDSDNEVEGVDVKGEKSDEDATYVEDQGNEADRDTNAYLEGRDDEAKTSHAVAANLSELELKKILIDKMEANKSISRPRDEANDDQEPSAGTDRGSKRRRSGKEPESTSAPRETTAEKTTTGSKTHKQSASQSALVEKTMQSTDVFEAPAHQEFETGDHDEQAEEEVHHLPDWFQQPKRLPSPDHAWNKSVPAIHESIQPWLSNLARRQDP
ncbi:hypothetical protein Tco_0217851 [Tanacetum coccineum]